MTAPKADLAPPAVGPDSTPRRTEVGIARHPDASGLATSIDGTRLAWEAFGDGSPTIVLLPSAPIVHSRQWKGQIAYLSRSWRVVTYDGRGNGLSDRPTDPAAYHDDRFVDDVAAVMDATATDRAVLVGLCVDGVWRAIRTAVARPDRVLGILAFAVGVPSLAPPPPHYITASASFEDELPAYESWQKLNRHHWRRDYADWVRFFFGQMNPEPHSSKAIDDAVDWSLDTSVEVMLARTEATFTVPAEEVAAVTGLTTDQVARIVRDIEGKRRAGRYLHHAPIVQGRATVT